jgi:WYL_2, Sm-like SH3 beta-barrel fold
MFDNDVFNKSEVWRLLNGAPGSWYQEAEEAQREELRTWMRQALHEQQVQVKFVKTDGTMRVMNCTLNEDLGAKIVNKESSDKTNTKQPNLEVCTVWDCEANGWRSFRWDRLREINFTIG